MAGNWFENVIYSEDIIVFATLQLNRGTNTRSNLPTSEQPIAAPASTDHHTIVAFKEKASVKHAP